MTDNQRPVCTECKQPVVVAVPVETTPICTNFKPRTMHIPDYDTVVNAYCKSRGITEEQLTDEQVREILSSAAWVYIPD